MSATAPRHYRDDIDGLRGVAVLGVLVYHAFPRFAPSGFTGVDVFFVISGYLITQIIARELAERRFSTAAFYARRIRRIFPALIVLLFAVFAIGWQTLFSIEFAQLGKHIAAGAGFVSNIVFYSEAGYFDYRSDTKPLLHLWSLGVEEQFYLAWPLVIVLAFRLFRRVDLFLVAVVLASFAANLVMTSADSAAAFYLPWSRCWQLACGGLLAIRPGAELSPASRHGLSAGGIAMIAAALFAVAAGERYPGWYALLPTLGAAALIAAGPMAAVNRLLSTALMRGIGLISYPLYLWHWPLLTFATILDGPLPSRTVRAVLVLASVVLAVATYWFVERPLRTSRKLMPIAAGLLAAMTVVGLAGYAAYVTRGLPARGIAKDAEPYISTMARSERIEECFDSVNRQEAGAWFCHLNQGGAAADTIVFGDSHAFALLPAFEAIANERKQDILFASAPTCPPLLGLASSLGDRDACESLNERVVRYVADRAIAHVFLIANWNQYAGADDASRSAFEVAVRDTVSRYRQLPVTAHFVATAPAQPRFAIDMIRHTLMRGAPADIAIRDLSVSTEAYRRSGDFMRATLAANGVHADLRDRAELVGLESVYCRDGVCPFGREGVSYYFDASHLSAQGAVLAVPELAGRFDR
jgi:peptidoglycan/LPS O-acetylase OafA/YrhL